MSLNTVVYALIAYQIASFILKRWIRRGRARWELRLRAFAARHDGEVVEGDPDRRLLLIVVPSSGAGRAMDVYDDCIAGLRRRNFGIDVHVTKSSEDIKTLTARRGKDGGDLSRYYGIALLGGDSSITELVQASLVEHDGKWIHPPILHLPGGSTNLLSKELHRGKSLSDVVSQFSADKVKRASAIKVSSPGNEEPIFATHVSIHGIGRHMLTRLEKQRSGLYAALGAMALPFLILPAVFSPPNRDESPYFALLVASTKNCGGGNDIGFDLDLFDEKLLVMHLTRFKGGFRYVREAMVNMLNGEMARQYATSTLPEGLEVKMGNRFTFEDHDFHFILDGTTTVDLKGRTVTIESVMDAIPYFVLE